MKGLSHGALPKQELLALEEQADLCHEVRARPVPAQVHNHLKVRRREEAVGAAGLAVRVIGRASGTNQVGVSRGFARHYDFEVRKSDVLSPGRNGEACEEAT